MKRRRHLFRIAALVVGLLVAVTIELACRVFHTGADEGTNDGYVEYLSQRPLFVLDEAEQTYQIAENRLAYFAADSFSKQTNETTRRIFVLGGSTVQGRPYSLPTSFPTCMEAGLKTAAPEYEWKVVNCGGVSYASYRLLPILDEVLNYEPAAIVLCTGHNEFLEFMTYRDAVQAIDTFGETAVSWSNLASIQMLRRWFAAKSEPGIAKLDDRAIRPLPTEVDALLDQSDGWALYHRDVLDRERIQSQFVRNLNRIVRTCHDRKIPLLIVSPVVNLRDCPPFKSEFDSSIDDVQQQKFLDQLAEAVRIGDTTSRDAILTLKELCASQPRYALAWYQLGRKLLGQGLLEEARTAFQTACDEDICPLRMTSKLRLSLRQVARDSDVGFVDLHQFLAAESRQGIVGGDTLVDHVHPSFTSQRKIGCLLAERMLELLAIPPTVVQWREPTIEKLKTDFNALDSMYFLRGRRALDNLNGWARGRAHGTPLNSPEGD